MHSYFTDIPAVKLAQLPTPVTPLARLAEVYHHEPLYVKQDNLSGPEYGGNKIRKLEFLLGEALAQGRKSVITYGAAGSNHALATALCCRQLGLKAISILAPQATSEHVRKNILMQQAAGAELCLCPHYNDFPQATRRLSQQYTQKDGTAPYIIPAGGTSALGALGFVKAAFELAEQILPPASCLPAPDVIYLPMGTGGTLAGLLVGLTLAGLKTRIEAVRVVDAAFRNESHILRLCTEICARLGIEPNIDAADICIRNEFYGLDYGLPTPEGRAAVEAFKTTEGIELENTYTGKTAAALLHDLKTGRLDGKTVLYWNTLNSRDLSRKIAGASYQELPPEFHAYFASD